MVEEEPDKDKQPKGGREWRRKKWRKCLSEPALQINEFYAKQPSEKQDSILIQDPSQLQFVLLYKGEVADLRDLADEKWKAW